ncbi:MAG: hypothetical protein AAFX06_16845 [Planctomycetota bacterium]
MDWRITDVPPGHRKSLDEVIAAAVFSFQRLAEAKLRCEQLLGFVMARELSDRDVGLWLVAREALANDATRVAGERLAERARQAVEFTDAISVEALR